MVVSTWTEAGDLWGTIPNPYKNIEVQVSSLYHFLVLTCSNMAAVGDQVRMPGWACRLVLRLV